MQRQLAYLSLSIGSIAVIVIIKLWAIPFILWKLFPQTDLISRLYEVFIMAFGGISFLLFIVMGYMGKHIFRLSAVHQFSYHFIIQLPFVLHALFGEMFDQLQADFLSVFADGWCGLISEPTRLLFMVYPWTDIFAIATSFILLGIGRRIEIVDEERKNRVRVGSHEINH